MWAFQFSVCDVLWSDSLLCFIQCFKEDMERLRVLETEFKQVLAENIKLKYVVDFLILKDTIQ